jgi:hypothetical protein
MHRREQAGMPAANVITETPRQNASEPRNERDRNRYARKAEKLRKLARLRRRRLKVEPEILKAAQQDPQYEDRHKILEYVICRVAGCGRRVARVDAHSLPSHGLNADGYRLQFPGAQLRSVVLGTDITRRRKRVGKGLRGRARHGASRGHQKSARRWDVVCRIVKGDRSSEIAKLLKNNHSAVLSMARKMGLSVCRHDFGEVADRPYVAGQYEATGLDSRDFASFAGISQAQLYDISVPTLRAFRTPPAIAASVFAWRDGFILELARNHRKGRHSKLRQTLNSFFPTLRRKRDMLIAILKQSREFLRQAPGAGAEHWQDWMCDQAGRECAGLLPGDRFTKFLPFAPEVSPFLGENLSKIRAGAQLTPLALGALASRINVGRHIVERCARRGARPLTPRQMRDLILITTLARRTAARSAGAKVSKPRGGAPRGPRKSTLLRIEVMAAARVQKLGPKDCYATLLFKGTPERQYARCYGFSSEYESSISSRASEITSETATDIRAAAENALKRLKESRSRDL